MIQWDHGAVSLKHRPWNITAPTPNAIATYLCWAQFSLRFWHFWWVSSPVQWLPTISKPVLSISLIVGRLYIRISLTTREILWLRETARASWRSPCCCTCWCFGPGTTCAAGGSLGLASGKLPSAHIASYEKGRCCQAPPIGETDEWELGTSIGLHQYCRPRQRTDSGCVVDWPSLHWLSAQSPLMSWCEHSELENKVKKVMKIYINGFVQERHKSSALSMELHLSGTNLSISSTLMA